MKRDFNVYQNLEDSSDDDFVVKSGGGSGNPPIIPIVEIPAESPVKPVVPPVPAVENPDPGENIDPGGDEIDTGTIIPLLAEDINTPVPSDFDFDSFSKELGLENPTPVKSKDEFKKVFEEKLERQKSIVKFDLGKYGDEVIEMAEYLSTKGSLKDFLDPIKDFNEFLALPNDQKMISSFMAQGYSEQVAQDKVLELTEDGTLDQKANTLTKNVTEERDKTIKGIMKRSESVMTTRTEKLAAKMTMEKELFKSKVAEITDFVGVPLTDADRKAMVAHIESGAFFKAIENNPVALIKAYLFSLIGDSVTQQYENLLKEAKRLGFNDADIRRKSRYRTDPVRTAGASGSSEPQKGLSSME